jgi:hypothetical protein
MTTATDPKPSIDTLLLDVTNAKLKVTPEHFDQLCIANPDLHLELTKDTGRKVWILTRIVEPKQIIFYTDEDGNEPFQLWLDALRDEQGRRRIVNRLVRVQQGNYGDVEPIASLAP